MNLLKTLQRSGFPVTKAHSAAGQ